MDTEANQDPASSHPTDTSGLCYTCLSWMFRSIPVLIIFLVINCIRAVFFDQKSAFTIINITLGLILFAVVTVSVYTFISLQFYRIQSNRRDYLPGSGQLSTISSGRHQREHHGRRGAAEPMPNDESFVFNFMDDLGLGQTRCRACSTVAGPGDSSAAVGTEAGTSTTHREALAAHRHHATCPHNRHHRRNAQRKPRRVVEDDCPPSYEEAELPPKYEELSAFELFEKEEDVSLETQHQMQEEDMPTATNPKDSSSC